LGQLVRPVRDGDVVQIKEKSRELPLVLDATDSPERDLPDYIDVNLKDMSATYVRGPKLADVPYPAKMEPHLAVESYSR
jgi:small subunit ribosomal protein S4